MLRSYNPERAALRAAKAAAERQRRKDARLAALMATIPRRSSTWSADTPIAPAPKDPPGKNRALLDMARGRPCLIRSPLCVGGTETTVACHGAGIANGKGMGWKVSDAMTCWGCWQCNHYTDAYGGASTAQKLSAFQAGHSRQVLAWRVVATDSTEPERYRRAALWALERLGATPVTDIDTAP